MKLRISLMSSSVCCHSLNRALDARFRSATPAAGEGTAALTKYKQVTHPTCWHGRIFLHISVLQPGRCSPLLNWASSAGIDGTPVQWMSSAPARCSLIGPPAFVHVPHLEPVQLLLSGGPYDGFRRVRRAERRKKVWLKCHVLAVSSVSRAHIRILLYKWGTDERDECV